MNGPKQPILGVDVGGVIIDRDSSLWQSWLFCQSGRYLEVPPVADAFRGLAQLNRRFGGRVFIISKCDPKTAARTQEWFRHFLFYEETGLDPKQTCFAPDLAGKTKHCVRLGVTHFIDNRIKFLRLLRIVEENRLLLSAGGQFWGKLRRPNGSRIRIFARWPDIVAHLKKTV